MALPSENFARWALQTEARFPIAVGEVCNQLAQWAREEHRYQDRTGNTTASTVGMLTDIEPDVIRGAFGSAMSYDVFLELARGGQWAYLVPVILRHKDDITAVFLETMGKGEAPSGGSAFDFLPNPDLSAEYEAFKEAARKK